MCDQISIPSNLPDREKMLRRAVFLDRDGTINVEKGYLFRAEEFEFIPGVPQALKRLQDAGFLLVVVTNQSGVARGYYTLEDVDILHRHMCSRLQKYGVTLAGIYVCPHHPTAGNPPYRRDCECRKGRPGLLLQAAEELDIDLADSFMVGDKNSDIEAGENAGCHACLVASGHSLAGAEEANVFADLPAVTDMILSGDASCD